MGAPTKLFLKPGEFFVVDSLGGKWDRIPCAVLRALESVGVEVRDWDEGIIPSDVTQQGKGTY